MNLLAVATSDVIGLSLLIALLYSSHIRRASNEEHLELKIFTTITIMTLIACPVDFLQFYADGKDGLFMRYVSLICNTYCFLVNPIFISSWCAYEDMRLYHSRARLRRIYTKAFIPAIILGIISLVNVFYPLVFYIDEANLYHRLPLSYVYYVVDFGYLLFSIFILKKYESRYGKVRFFPLFLMVGPIVLGCFLQAVFYGVSLIWVSLATGLISIYMSLQNEFSYMDKLTGLYNRAYLDYQLDMAKKTPGTRFGGVMIDVDYFKQINDTYGHSMGDEALVDVARIITFSKPEKAIATRFAGDEFILLVKDTNESEMERILSDLLEELKLFNQTEQRIYKLSLSMGYSIFDPASDSLDDFLKNMDDNMYKQKNVHHNN